MIKEIAVFSGQASGGFAKEICGHLGVPLLPSRLQRFANDCLEVQLLENCRERDVFIVQPLVKPVQENLMELLMMLLLLQLLLKVVVMVLLLLNHLDALVVHSSSPVPMGGLHRVEQRFQIRILSVQHRGALQELVMARFQLQHTRALLSLAFLELLDHVGRREPVLALRGGQPPDAGSGRREDEVADVDGFVARYRLGLLIIHVCTVSVPFHHVAPNELKFTREWDIQPQFRDKPWHSSFH